MRANAVEITTQPMCCTARLRAEAGYGAIGGMHLGPCEHQTTQNVPPQKTTVLLRRLESRLNRREELSMPVEPQP